MCAVSWTKLKGSSKGSPSARFENNNRRLVIPRVQPEDDGSYECRASNAYGSDTAFFTVTVRSTPYCYSSTFPTACYFLRESSGLRVFSFWVNFDPLVDLSSYSDTMIYELNFLTPYHCQ